MRTLLATVAVLTAMSTAHADGFSCTRSRGTFNCVRTYGGQFEQLITLPLDTSPEATERRRLFDERCQPRGVVGRNGVTYMQYAHKDCNGG